MTFSSRASFTLIELLIVIAIVAVLSVVVLVTLNPVELLKQARDSTRISDLDTINRALSLFTYALPNDSLGDPTKIYISVPDPNLATATGTCTASMGLSAPSGYTYLCASSSTFTRIDGSGWIPVDFTQMTGINAPLSRLPADPTNTTSSGFYYMYVPGGSWALTALLQSQKYLQQNATKDGGLDPGRFEVGSDLALVPKAQGLVWYWQLDTTSGATATDISGNNHHGTISGSPSWVAGKVGNGLSFNGTNTYITLATSSINPATIPLTMMAWFKTTNSTGQVIAQQKDLGGTGRTWMGLFGGSCGITTAYTFINGGGSCKYGNTSISQNIWHHIAITSNPAANIMKLYVNGALEVSSTSTPDTTTGDILVGVFKTLSASFFYGTMDEILFYKRALSGAEIKAIYDATL